MQSHRRTSHGVSERSLRRLWQLVQTRKGELLTAAGKPVEVLSPGVPNHDGGPDFRNALIRIGGILYRGDVEVHLHAGDWLAHAHHRNGKYNGVILHVVLDDDPKLR